MFGCGGPWFGGWGMRGFGFGGGGLFWILFVVLIALAVDLAVRSRGKTRRRDEASPLEIAKTRYARGEISKEEYEQIRRDLS